METDGKELDVAQIFAAPRKTQTVEVPEWGEGGFVRVRGLSAREVVDIATAPEAHRIGQVVSLGVVDRDGQRKFSDGDAEKLMESDAAPIMRIHNAIMVLSKGLDDAAREAARKNSESAPPAASHSA